MKHGIVCGFDGKNWEPLGRGSQSFSDARTMFKHPTGEINGKQYVELALFELTRRRKLRGQIAAMDWAPKPQASATTVESPKILKRGR